MSDPFADDEMSGTPPELPVEPPPSFRWYNHPAVGFPLIILGVLVLAINGILEAGALQSQAWHDAVWSPDGDSPWEDAIPVRSRMISWDNFPDLRAEIDKARDDARGRQAEQLEAILANSGMEDTERVVFLDLPSTELESLIVSGRLPEPGQPEVLAGVFARLDSFEMDDVTFTVVGHLASSISGFHFAYILPTAPEFEPLFSEEQDDVAQGWLLPSGRARLAEDTDDLDALQDQQILGQRVPTSGSHAWVSMMGLLLVAVGGTIAHMTVFTIASRRHRGILAPGIRAALEQPRVLVGMHVVLFGSFFAMMAVGIVFPVPHLWLQNFIAHEFSTGGLSYVGDAYASERVFAAALMTWVNNFVVQTVGMTFGISLVIPLLGLLKNLASFTMVGFGMAPLWSGMAWMFSFHSITMTLELEAYIIACVIVVYFWRRVIVGLRDKEVIPELRRGFRALGSGIMLTGTMLGIAALYEAATLILLR
jgi:hypothetical protein